MTQRTRLTLGGTLLAVALATVAATAHAAAPAGVVNLNSATAEQLQLLPRIGPAIAQRIVEHRKANGPFTKVEDLLLVRGIGEATFASLKPYLTLSGDTTLREKVRLPRTREGKAKA